HALPARHAWERRAPEQRLHAHRPGERGRAHAADGPDRRDRRRAVADTRLRPIQLSRGAGEQVRPAGCATAQAVVAAWRAPDVASLCGTSGARRSRAAHRGRARSRGKSLQRKEVPGRAGAGTRNASSQALAHHSSERGDPTVKSRAAVAWAAGRPLSIEEVDVAAPKAGEVLV